MRRRVGFIGHGSPGWRLTRRIRLAVLALAAVMMLTWAHAVHAESDAAVLTAFLAKLVPSDVVPGADRIGPFR